MNDIQAFKDLKKAKVHCEHLEDILKIVNLSARGLKLYEMYGSVKNILSVIREEKKILENQLKLQKDIVKNKGKR